MTPQEQQLLQDLTQKINQTVLPEKDPEAEQFLMSSLSRNPDAVYILAQTVLVQNYALTQAQQQIAQLKQQPAPAAAPQKHGSFLGNLLGLQDQAPAPPPMPTQTYTPTPQAQYAPVNVANQGLPQGYPQPDYGPQAAYGQPQYGQPQYGQPQYGQPQFGQQPQQGGFLRSAMQTAAGVAAGAMLFQGAESLLGGFEHHAGYGGRGFEDQGGGGREEVINNYYGDSAREDQGGGHEGRHFGDNLPDTLSPDIEDRRDDNNSRNFADTGDSGSDDDASAYDSSSSDDNFSDDSSSDNDDDNSN